MRSFSYTSIDPTAGFIVLERKKRQTLQAGRHRTVVKVSPGE